MHMTTLIGLKQDDFVLITGDTKKSHLDSNNQILDTYDSNRKVYPICENMIIGIAGSDRIGRAIVNSIEPIFSLNHKLSFKELVQHVQKSAISLHEMYKQVHSDKNYYDVELLLAGIDHKENKSYLFCLRSLNGFEPVECNNDIIATGIQAKEAMEFIGANMADEKYSNPITLFSAAIRSINHQMVSKDTISLFLNKQKIADFVHVDEQGGEKNITKSFNKNS